MVKYHRPWLKNTTNTTFKQTTNSNKIFKKLCTKLQETTHPGLNEKQKFSLLKLERKSQQRVLRTITSDYFVAISESGVLEKGKREKICSEAWVNCKKDSLDLSLIEEKSRCEKNMRKLWKRKLGKWMKMSSWETLSNRREFSLHIRSQHSDTRWGNMTEPKEENSKKWGEKYRRIVDWKNEENNTIRHKCPLHKSRESAPIKYKLTTSTNYNQLSNNQFN